MAAGEMTQAQDVKTLLQFTDGLRSLTLGEDPAEAKALLGWVGAGGLEAVRPALETFLEEKAGEMTCTDPVADLKNHWPTLYRRIKDQVWFRRLAAFYYSSNGSSLLQNKPIAEAWGVEPDEEVKTILEAKSPSDPRWWVIPHTCHLVNGVFLYFVLEHEDYEPRIFESPGHVFLRDKTDTIYDLYWQPLGISGADYTTAKEVDPVAFWEAYDFLRWLREAGLVT